MLQSSKLKMVMDLISTSTREELIWINGYLSGIVSSGKQPEAASKPVAGKVTIAYGSETGNSKRLATDFAAKAKQKGINARLVSLEQYRPNDLAKEEFFFTVISTQGDGEPPASAKKFYDHIHQNGFKLQQLKYGVLALGDTSYPLFCKAGEDVDAQLQKLGGERIVSLEKCDTDYEDQADAWFQNVLGKLSLQPSAPAPQVVAKKSSGKKTYTGKILTNICLNDSGSLKQTHHIEIEAEDVDYQPGDSLGMIPWNSETLVQNILQVAGAEPDIKITYKNESQPAALLLKSKLNILSLSERVIAKYSELIGQQVPATRIGLLDLLKIYPLKTFSQFDDLVSILDPITPRLYSISSSPNAHPGEIHLTVARDSYTINEEKKYGHCSDLLCQIAEGSEIEFYIHKNSQFKLPADDKDVIMIGPGTGIAPFRSFLAERDATGSSGRNWLFFGDQHFATDFLYQTEIQNWAETGVLSKVNVAFSRDQKEKIYVQHRMLAKAVELYEWLENGASLYVCGAKDPMSNDVEAMLARIVHEAGGHTPDAAEAYIDRLIEEGRYLKDVY
jgi:sulfite reductase (NADPH) flavoprotein alpha-component